VTRKYFGTDGVRGRVGETPITPEFVMRLGHAAGRVLASARQHAQSCQAGRPASGADRQGHPDLGLHAGGGARSRVFRCRCRCLSGRTDADAGHGTTSLAPCACRRGSSSRRRTTRTTTTGSSSSRRTEASCPMIWNSEIEAALDEPMTCVPSAGLGRRAADRRCRRPLHRVLQGHLSVSNGPARTEDRRRLRQRCCLSSRAACLSRTGCRSQQHRHRTQWPQHQPGCWRDSPCRFVQGRRGAGADLGIALDGDADRLIMVDALGQVYDGDQLLFAVVRSRLRQGPVAGVVGTLMRVEVGRRRRVGHRPTRAAAASR
jgi:phosphoglucosamine mutase